MQIAMDEVSAENRKEDLPQVEMGIGLHTGQVVVGNIGSPERMKYGVVGSHVNLTSRIQACTTGGQILVSETTRQELGNKLKIGKQMEVRAKGIEHPVVLFEALGVGGRHKLSLPEAVDTLVPLEDEIPLRYEVVESSQGRRRDVERCPDQNLLERRRSASREHRPDLEQSQDASHWQRRRATSRNYLWQGAGSVARYKYRRLNPLYLHLAGD